MRITFDASPEETLEYLSTVNSVLRNNSEVESNVKAYQALKELVLSFDKRLNKIEESERRSRVCR